MSLAHFMVVLVWVFIGFGVLWVAGMLLEYLIEDFLL